MKNYLLHQSLLSIVIATCFSISTLAQESPQEGVKVGKMSYMRKLIPAGALEGQAAQQYQQTLQDAQKKNALVSDNHPQVIRLRQIAQKIIPFALPWNKLSNNWKWEVNLIASDEVNAYCMPGGKIAFYTGILDKLKLTDDEVAMIMGHEIAHALREHGAERAGKAVAVNLTARFLGFLADYNGYDGNSVAKVAGVGGGLLSLKYSRDDETEGDIVGMDIAARAGYDPRAGIALWQKMGMLNSGAPPQWLSTHPSGSNRIREIQKHLPEVMPLYARAKGLNLQRMPAYQSNVKEIAPIK